MELKIVSKTHNAAFNRTEIIASISGYSSTPSRKEVVGALCSELKCDEGCLVINNIRQPFGAKTATVQANVYASPAEAKKIEPAFKFKRGMPSEAKQAEAQANATGAPTT